FFANPSEEILNKYIHENFVSFCVHPANIESKKKKVVADLLNMKKESSIEAVPTSSSRTVIPINLEKPIHAIKCHCPFKISRFYRNLGPLTIQQSITISSILDQTNIAHLPETIGIAFPGKEGKSGWGFIVREMIPRLNPTEKRLMIPCFALYGKDMYHL